jgi:imidazolonepropionase-like amidohydrolase
VKLTFKNANIIDIGSGDIHAGQSIIVEDGVIQEISTSTKGTDINDLQGSFVIPGLIDAHVHLVWEGQSDPVRAMLDDPSVLTAYRAARSLYSSLSNGVTTVRDVGGPYGIPLAAARAVRAGMIKGADVLAAGSPVVMTGGHVYTMSLEADGPDEIRKAVRSQVKAGADFIKIMASGGAYTPGESIYATQLTPDEIGAAADEAHRAHRRIAAHALNPDAISNVLDAGIDTVEHGALASDENIQQFKNTGAYLIPTLSPYYLMARKGSELGVPDYAVEKSKQVMEKYYDTMTKVYRAGVNIGLGTDAGSPCIPHACVAFEAWIWATECRIEPRKILQAATLGAAQALGLTDRGVVEVGKRADLVAFEQNPLEDISVLHEPQVVLQCGMRCPEVTSAWSQALIREL